MDERKWVKSQPAGKASPGAGKVWVPRPRPLGIKASALWRSHGLFSRFARPAAAFGAHSFPWVTAARVSDTALRRVVFSIASGHHFAGDLSPGAAHAEQPICCGLRWSGCPSQGWDRRALCRSPSPGRGQFWSSSTEATGPQLRSCSTGFARTFTQ